MNNLSVLASVVIGCYFYAQKKKKKWTDVSFFSKPA